MTYDLETLRSYGLGNKTAFFNKTYYTYHDGAIHEVKIVKVVFNFKNSSTSFSSTYPGNSATDGEYKFVFKVAGLEGLFKNEYVYLDPLREKKISVHYVAMLAITDWLGKPQLIDKEQRYHLGGALFYYNAIVNGAFANRRGFIKKVVATPDDVVVDILTSSATEVLSQYDNFSKADVLTTISSNDKESVKKFTMTKDDILAELSTKIVKFSDEDKRAEEEKVQNIIGNLHASIQAAVQDYAQGYPISVTIRVAGQVDKI